MNIVFIGAGNLATSLSVAFQQAHHTISQVYSRTMDSARTLARQLGPTIAYTNSLQALDPSADLYVFAVVDSVMESLAAEVACALAGRTRHTPLFVHTACTHALQVLSPLSTVGHIGVFYPFQAFSRQRLVDLTHTPFFIEGDSPDTLQALRSTAMQLTDKVYTATYEQRLHLHLAGVMSNNFTNCLFAISGELLEKAGLPFDILLPALDETVRKVHTLSPRQAQSGPARRGDSITIEKHLRLLDRFSEQEAETDTDSDPSLPSLQAVYRFFTHNIQSHKKQV